MRYYKVILTTRSEITVVVKGETNILLEIDEAMRDRRLMKWVEYRAKDCTRTIYINPAHIVSVEEERP